MKTFERLLNYASAFSVLAWRLYWCKHINTIDPAAPATLVFTPYELEVMRLRIEKRNRQKNVKKIIPSIKTVRDGIRYVASFGGFNGRKCDGGPGIITLWREFLLLQARADTLEDVFTTYQLDLQ